MQRIIVDLPEPDGPQMTMRSPRADMQVDVAQDVELAVPFVHADHLHGRLRLGVGHRGADGGLGGRGCCRHGAHRFWPAASRRSTAIE